MPSGLLSTKQVLKNVQFPLPSSSCPMIPIEARLPEATGHPVTVMRPHSSSHRGQEPSVAQGRFVDAQLPSPPLLLGMTPAGLSSASPGLPAAQAVHGASAGAGAARQEWEVQHEHRSKKANLLPQCLVCGLSLDTPCAPREPPTLGWHSGSGPEPGLNSALPMPRPATACAPRGGPKGSPQGLGLRSSGESGHRCGPQPEKHPSPHLHGRQ